MKTTLRSHELTCPSCIVKIEKQLQRISGVESVDVQFQSGRIVVEHDEEQAGTDALVDAVRKVGYEVRVAPF